MELWFNELKLQVVPSNHLHSNLNYIAASAAVLANTEQFRNELYNTRTIVATNLLHCYYNNSLEVSGHHEPSETDKLI